MEGYLTRSYSSPVRRTLRRETRSISEWLENGRKANYFEDNQPFDLSLVVEKKEAKTWDHPRRPSWVERYGEEEYKRDVTRERRRPSTARARTMPVRREEPEYTHRPQPVQRPQQQQRPQPKPVQDYFTIAVPKTTLPARTPDLFAEEPLADDIPESELESSRRRSIEIQKQASFMLEEDVGFVDQLARHFGELEQAIKPIVPAPLPTPAATPEMKPEEPKEEVPVQTVEKAQPKEEPIIPADPPSPDFIIEHAPKPVAKKANQPSARDRFMKAKKVLFTVDVLKKCIPPAPLPEMLIDDVPRPKKKVPEPIIEKLPETPKIELPKIDLTNKLGARDGGVLIHFVEQITTPIAPEPIEEPVSIELPASIPLPTTPIEEATATPIVTVTTPSDRSAEISPPLSTSPSFTGGVSLNLPFYHRHDEGYLSGSDSGSDYGVSLDAPLPDEVIPVTTYQPIQGEKYQHHCVLHGHFFPKVGPLRSAGWPHEPFDSTICCDRCGNSRLVEAWQCALLNVCGLIFCTPCYEELEGITRPEEEVMALPIPNERNIVVEEVLDARQGGLKEGLQMGMEQGLKIGLDVAMAKRAVEALRRGR
ncbi:hypothetical protein FPQ18DRAFT_302033 [Pyronema domesticum]|uniref:Uncharacterized protein n=1 Tax=Pyronema omphalodes (strain CBS 100304) TaxID=1076935 RepID=U4L1G6_PYROM|nr:hypothetical protein FPQ18DRAFT_302033 [Pyronema domesticum]CCX08327.1 Protein of unknown function [Pyronema omphalodes CBS 100304]